MQFTLKQLRVFKAIDEFGSTTAAGQVLALSQSAVSSLVAATRGKHRTATV